MNLIQKIFLCLSIVITNYVYAMDVPQARVHIVDTTEGQSIRSAVGNDPAIISVFGATPRYSSFELYQRTLQEDCSQLLSLYDAFVKKQGKEPNTMKGALRGVQTDIIKLMTELRERPGLAAFRDDLVQLSDAEFMQLFFAAGFHHETLAENISTLLATAQRYFLEKRTDAHEQFCLVHVFVPSYFADLAHLRTMEHAPRILHQFLKHAANHYKRHYEPAAAQVGFPICILIPPIKYFTAMMHAGACQRAQTDIVIVKREIVEQLNSSCQFALLDQGSKEKLDEMVAILQSAGTRDTVGVKIPLISKESGEETHTFNPYVLVPPKKDDSSASKKRDFKSSPLINQQLVTFIQQKHEGERHE